MYSPRAPSRILNLSSEIIGHIIDHLDIRDVFTIKACSLVSRAFSNCARARLFKYVHRKVVPGKNEHQLEECIRTSAMTRGLHDFPCASDLVQNIELCGNYLFPSPCITTTTLHHLLSYMPRLRRLHLHHYCLDYQDPQPEPPSGAGKFKLQELDLQVDFRTTIGLINVLGLFSRVTFLRLRQIVPHGEVDFPQTQENVEAEINRVAPACPLDIRVTQLEVYLWQIGPVCLELLKQAAHKCGVAISDIRIRCDSGQRNFRLVGAFFNDTKMSYSLQNVTIVYPFYGTSFFQYNMYLTEHITVPGPLTDFSALQLRSLRTLASLTVEGFYLGEIQGEQAPFSIIPQLLSSWTSLPTSNFRLNMDIVFARRLSCRAESFPRPLPIDVIDFLMNKMDAEWTKIQSVLEQGRFPEVVFRLKSQEGDLGVDEKSQLAETIYTKLCGLTKRGILTVKVTEP